MKVQIAYFSFNFLCFSSGVRRLIGVRLFCSFRQASRRFELIQFDSFKHFLTFSGRVIFFYGITTFLWTLPIKKNKGIKVTLSEKWWRNWIDFFKNWYPHSKLFSTLWMDMELFVDFCVFNWIWLSLPDQNLELFWCSEQFQVLV